jgi:hypothetical protein
MRSVLTTYPQHSTSMRSSLVLHVHLKRPQVQRQKCSPSESVGDTVLLATNIKKPSVGIIIGLWEVSRPVTDSQMLARVHWFFRPTELAQLRAKRGHLPVRHDVLRC